MVLILKIKIISKENQKLMMNVGIWWFKIFKLGSEVQLSRRPLKIMMMEISTKIQAKTKYPSVYPETTDLAALEVKQAIIEKDHNRLDRQGLMQVLKCQNRNNSILKGYLAEIITIRKKKLNLSTMLNFQATMKKALTKNNWYLTNLGTILTCQVHLGMLKKLKYVQETAFLEI